MNRYLLGFLFLGSLLLHLCLGGVTFQAKQIQIGFATIARSQDVSQLVEQGIDRYQSQDLKGAIEYWEAALTASRESNSSSDEQVTLWKYLARAYQQVGNLERAIANLENAIAYYREAGNNQLLGRMLTEVAQAYSSLGQHRRAAAILCGDNTIDIVCSEDTALDIARRESDKFGEAAALGSLGNIYRLQGKYTPAIKSLEASLAIAQEFDYPVYMNAALNNLGNVYASLGKRDYRFAEFASQTEDNSATSDFKQNASSYDRTAVKYFTESLQLARSQNDGLSEMRALLNLFEPLRRSQLTDAVKLNQILEQGAIALETIPSSREKIYGAMELANMNLLSTLEPTADAPNLATECPNSEIPPKTIELLGGAVRMAQEIGDRTAESFAKGSLGHVYECLGKYDLALNLTGQAQLAGQKNDRLYLWYWQAGRIFQLLHRESDAIDAYSRAVRELKSIRNDLAIASRDFQLDFRETVEPVYRQLTELKLKLANNSTTTSEPQNYLNSAMETIDELRLAELQNYLGNECEFPVEKSVTSLSRSTAVFNSIILSDRIAIIVTLPEGESGFSSEMHWIPVDKTEAIEAIDDFRRKLEKLSDRTNSYQEKATLLYDWIIRPVADRLVSANIQTLVFVQDGILRSIPMGSLYDGKQFLIQKYAIANTPSLALTNPTSLSPEALQVLAFGLTKASAIDGETFFPPLDNVKLEIENIQTTIPASEGLLDREFTYDRLKQELEKNTYPILHLATHANFGIDSRKTFLVTGEVFPNNDGGAAYINEKLTMNQLYQLIKSTSDNEDRLELLILSACETAAGSDRDALGIAGIALQAGVKSAVATLWKVEDRTTAEMVARFYQNLLVSNSKALALQATQKAWLEEHPSGRYNHPGYWAPFILIGNWL